MGGQDVPVRFIVSTLMLYVLCGDFSFAKADEGNWLILSRLQIAQTFQISDVKEVPDTKGTPMDVHILRSGGDSVWVGFNKKLSFRLAMAGRGEKVHSIRVFIPILNLSKHQQEETFKVLANFFQAAVPNWQDAKNWPTESLKTSWTAAANAVERKAFNAKDLIAQSTMGQVTVSTFGVPPDIILYAATVRTSCIPQFRTQSASDVKNDPIQRLVC